MRITDDVLNTKVKDNYYMVCIWPAAEVTQTNAAEALLKQAGRIVYTQDVSLSYLGMKNFMTQIYGHQAWTGTIRNQFRGTMGKADACYKAGKTVKTYLFEAASLEVVIGVKEKIRELYGIEKSSVHISDNAKETYDMIQLLYNKNSVDFLNFAHPYQYKEVYSSIKKVEKLLQERNLDKSRFILGADAVMESCGLSKAKYVEFITDYQKEEVGDICGSQNVKYNIDACGMKLPELLYDSKNYFYFEGMKMVTPQCALMINQASYNKKMKRMLEKFVKKTQSGVKPYPQYRIRLRKIRAGCISKLKELINKIRK